MGVVSLQANIDQTYYRMLDAKQELELSRSFAAKRPSIAERMAAGKALRKNVPRAAHATYARLADRPDPIAILEKQNEVRVPKLVPVRYSRMLANPFAFLRGSAAVMAADLSNTAVTGIQVAACGDMHVLNFGVYASAERNLIFGINDFDEVFPGPWEWDLKRLAASAAVAVRYMRGDNARAEDAAQAIVRSYRRHIQRYAEMGYLEVWYARIDERAILDSISPQVRRATERGMSKARAKGHIRSLEKLTEKVGEEHRFIEDVPLITRETLDDAGVAGEISFDRALHTYIDSLPYDRKLLLSRYRIIDVVRKVVGVGSVGTSCWVILLQGSNEDDPLFLQIKEAQQSVLAPYVDVTLPFDMQGRRVVVSQHLTQGSPDIFLGWGENAGRHFYIRQLADMKGSVKFGEDDSASLAGFLEYCDLCGWALALAHSKGGDPAMIAGYCGNSVALDEAIGKFAMKYVKQTDQDHEALDKARRSGRIKAEAES